MGGGRRVQRVHEVVQMRPNVPPQRIGLLTETINRQNDKSKTARMTK